MPTSPIIVPIHLDALVVNQGVAARDGAFRYWPYNYQALKSFKSPEPEAFASQTGGTPDEGIYLHWTLPRALRSGTQASNGSGVTYPLVPNRWLIVRTHGDTSRTATAWVIESDCPLTPGVQHEYPNADVAQMAMYLVDPEIVQGWLQSPDPLRHSTDLDPSSQDPLIANIGLRFPLTAPWSERADGDKGFLTAVAAGNPAFSIYRPHNVGVFSMHDDLAGIDSGTISYMALGWYSSPADDVLASLKGAADRAEAYKALLSDLNWSTSGGSKIAADQTLYQGMALSIGWNRTGNPPDNDPLQEIRNSGKLNVAVGNTTIDAFSTMIGTQLKQAGHPDTTANLLRAFQYDLLPLLNEVNGDAILDEKIRQAWFGSEPGGYWWTIADTTDENADDSTQLTKAEADWLAQLNADQVELDENLEALFALQWDFNAAWWKLGQNPDDFFPPLDGAPTNAELQSFLDPDNSVGVTGKLLSRFQAVQRLLAKVPRPSTAAADTAQDAWQAGIADFASAKGLSSGKVLKAVPGARYWRTNNPVVLLSGVKPSASADPDEALVVRAPDELISMLVVDGKQVQSATLASAMPAITNASGIPALVPQLMGEFVLLDPASAGMIAKACGLPEQNVFAAITARSSSAYPDTLPQFGAAAWSQPWNPMYVEWKVTYAQIPEQSGANRNWSFDGTDYRFTPRGTQPQPESREIGGISLLSPHTQSTFRKRLVQFLEKFPNADLSQLDTWIGQIDDWAFLAQELTGLNEVLALRDPRAFRRPAPGETMGSGSNVFSIADLAGFPSDKAAGQAALPNAYEGHVTTTPYLPNGPDVPFHGIRQGQFFFSDLKVYDKFGRVLWVIEKGKNTGLYDANNFPVMIDADLQPATSVFPQIKSVVEVPTRPLQPTRLNFSLLDGFDDGKVLGTSPNVNPIAGWVLPNHLDHSLSLYAPNGMALGEFRMFTQADGSLSGQWERPPHGDVTSLADVKAHAPHLFEMISAPALSSQANFEAFMQVVDSTLWTVDPLGNRSDQNLSVLVGRPLALVRARLSLRTKGPALRDTSWGATLDPPAPPSLGAEFAVRLGDQATREDGVIGYFTASDYGRFSSVAAPETLTGQTYVSQIGPVGNADSGNFLTLKLADTSVQLVTILTDPRAAMHAITGILPVKQAQIPAQFVHSALAQMEVSFHCGPLLTRVGPTPTQGGKTARYAAAVEMPLPTEQGGEWSWWEKTVTAPGSAGYDLLNPSNNAKLKSDKPSLREGSLQLQIDFSKTT
ncbi:hypothetical protein [Roseibium sp.]|uniref:hypothetical protein n=1 Tax=Roseibium sp. TaxID=1936156 RepID=UPI003A9770BA